MFPLNISLLPLLLFASSSRILSHPFPFISFHSSLCTQLFTLIHSHSYISPSFPSSSHFLFLSPTILSSCLLHYLISLSFLSSLSHFSFLPYFIISFFVLIFFLHFIFSIFHIFFLHSYTYRD